MALKITTPARRRGSAALVGLMVTAVGIGGGMATAGAAPALSNALGPAATAVPPTTVPVGVPTIDLPPVDLGSLLGPIALPVLGLPPVTVPPVVLDVPPIGLAPIEVPPISVPPIELPGLDLPLVLPGAPGLTSAPGPAVADGEGAAGAERPVEGSVAGPAAPGTVADVHGPVDQPMTEEAPSPALPAFEAVRETVSSFRNPIAGAAVIGLLLIFQGAGSGGDRRLRRALTDEQDEVVRFQ